jgi:hypothetical protein
LQEWPDKELLVCDDPNSKFDFDSQWDLAVRATEGLVAGPLPRATYLQVPTPFLGEKRNLMMQQTDGDLAVFFDDDDQYLPGYIKHAADYLNKNPDCPGNMRSANLWVYHLADGRYLRHRIWGGASTVLRADVMRKLLDVGFRYPEQKKRASDWWFGTDINNAEMIKYGGDDKETVKFLRHWNEGRFDASRRERLKKILASKAGYWESRQRTWVNSKIPDLGDHLVVIRAPTGHTCRSERGWGSAEESKYDKDLSWLRGKLPEPMLPLMEELSKKLYKPHPEAAVSELKLELPVWALQKKGYGLGNFLVMTPMLRGVSEKHGSPIPVFFATGSLKEIFQDCPFLEVLPNRPANEPTYQTRRPGKDREGNENDADCFYRVHVDDNARPPTYVDRPDPPADLPSGPKVAVFHGCLSHSDGKGKILSKRVRQAMLNGVIKAGATPVLLGNDEDRERFWRGFSIPSRVYSMLGKPLRTQVGALAACNCFISNDTGFAHVAGALEIPGTVLWRKSAFWRFGIPYPGVTHYRDIEGKEEGYIEAIQHQLNQVMEAAI